MRGKHILIIVCWRHMMLGVASESMISIEFVLFYSFYFKKIFWNNARIMEVYNILQVVVSLHDLA